MGLDWKTGMNSIIHGRKRMINHWLQLVLVPYFQTKPLIHAVDLQCNTATSAIRWIHVGMVHHPRGSRAFPHFDVLCDWPQGSQSTLAKDSGVTLEPMQSTKPPSFFQGARVEVSRPTVNWSWYNSELMIWLSWRPPSPSSPIQHPIQSSFFWLPLWIRLWNLSNSMFFASAAERMAPVQPGQNNAARCTSCPSIQVIMTLRQHWIGKKMPKLWLFCKSYDSWQTPTTLQFPFFFSQLELPPSSHSNSFSKMAQL